MAGCFVVIGSWPSALLLADHFSQVTSHESLSSFSAFSALARATTFFQFVLYLSWKKMIWAAKLPLENSDVYSGGSIRCYLCTSIWP
jgi:hypothetical protein